MAAGTLTLFSKNKNNLNIAALTGATVKMALITSAYTPDASVTGNSIFADASANEISAANGYTAGGVALTFLATTAISGGYKFSSADASWTGTGAGIAPWRYGLLYVSGTLWSLTNPLIGYLLGDTAPADIPATIGSLTIQCPAAGWLDAT